MQIRIAERAHKGDALVIGQLADRRRRLIREMERMGRAAHSESRAMQRGSNRSTQALFEIGNAMQDAEQFRHGFQEGLRATANNITQFAMLVGAGGPAVIALSAFTTGLALMQVGARKAKREMEALQNAASNVFQIDAGNGQFVKLTADNIGSVRSEIAAAQEAIADTIIGRGGSSQTEASRAMTRRILNSGNTPLNARGDEVERYRALGIALKQADEAALQFSGNQELLNAAREAGLDITDEELEKGDKRKSQLRQSLDAQKELKQQVQDIAAAGAERLAQIDRENQLLGFQLTTMRAIGQAQAGTFSVDRLDARGLRSPVARGESRFRTLGDKTRFDLLSDPEAQWLMGFGLNENGLSEEQQARYDAMKDGFTSALHSMGSESDVFAAKFRMNMNAVGDSAAMTFGAFADMAMTAFEASDGASRKSWRTFKAFSIAEALASTFVAANTALKSAPPPFGAIAMAATIAQGLANVRRIQAMEPGNTSASSAGAATFPTVSTSTYRPATGSGGGQVQASIGRREMAEFAGVLVTALEGTKLNVGDGDRLYAVIRRAEQRSRDRGQLLIT
ncbi:MAG: hypothetical protein AAGJ10_20590 [Bacteroidota bacterium]